MPYLLSLLGSEATIAGSQHHHCCYTNDTVDIQLLRAFKADECLFTRVVFPGERVLFAALPDAYLEVWTPLSASAQAQRMDCRHLTLHTGLQAAVAPPVERK